MRQSGGSGQLRPSVKVTVRPQGAGTPASSSSTRSRAAWCARSSSRRSRRASRNLPDGVLAGYPVVDVKVTLTFGSYHEVDSNENAFKIAAGRWASDACRRLVSRVILEPMMAVEVETPEDYAGSVMGDLSSRRGMVQGIGRHARRQRPSHQAMVPLSEMFGYSTTLRSMSQGRATYTMEFKHYSKPQERRDAEGKSVASDIRGLPQQRRPLNPTQTGLTRKRV